MDTQIKGSDVDVLEGTVFVVAGDTIGATDYTFIEAVGVVEGSGCVCTV